MRKKRARTVTSFRNGEKAYFCFYREEGTSDREIVSAFYTNTFGHNTTGEIFVGNVRILVMVCVLRCSVLILS